MYKNIVVPALVAIVCASATALLITSRDARADGDETTDGVPRVIAYSGSLEEDGMAVTDVLRMRFTLYDTETGAAVFEQTQSVEVYAGAFSVLIGPTADNATPLENVVDNADALELGITILGADDGTDTDDLELFNRQAIVATPYSIWAAESANLQVNGTLNVDGAAFVDGTMQVGGNATFSGGSSEVEVRSTDTNGGLEIRSYGGGAPYLDFSNDSGTDFDARLQLTSDDVLSLSGASLSTGSATITTVNATTVNADTLNAWPSGQYCIFRNGGSCPSGFAEDEIAMEIGSHGHDMCPGDEVAGDSTFQGAGYCSIRIRMCCR